MEIGWKKYIYALVITMVVFLAGVGISRYLNDKKIGELKLSGDKVSLDILSIETQFALLGEYSCEEVVNSDLSAELNNLGKKLSYGEKNSITSDQEFYNLKAYYSLLEIKEYLLIKKLGSKCNTKPVTILYFYSNQCGDCSKEGYVLTYIREKYPQIRVYSFDYDLELSALKTLNSVYSVTAEKLPFIVVNGKSYSGFKSQEEMESFLPKYIRNTATTTTKQ